MGISIIGTGMYIPKKVVTNDDFAELVLTSDEWITERTGIKQRHIATDITTFKMGANAAAMALENAALNALDIDMVIVSTVTGDYVSPSTACMIANEIGAYSAVCMDINCACAGFVYALDIAKKYLEEYKNILIVSTEMLSKITDYKDRSTCVLFGDGAGACIIANGENKLFACHLGGDATGVSKLFARGIPPSEQFRDTPFDRMADGFEESSGYSLYMNGKDVYRFATKVMPQAVLACCKKAGIDKSELSLIIPHQANIRIVETAAKNLALPIEKFFINIQSYGNMSSACIPICIHEATMSGKLNKGDKVCIVGFGAGLTYGAAIFEV